MKIPKIKKIPKTLSGLALIVAGSLLKGVHGMDTAGDALVKVGMALMTAGLGAKAIRASKGKDPLEHEKQLLRRGNGNAENDH